MGSVRLHIVTHSDP